MRWTLLVVEFMILLRGEEGQTTERISFMDWRVGVVYPFRFVVEDVWFAILNKSAT